MHKGVMHALAYATEMTHDLRAIHVTVSPAATRELKEEWKRMAIDVPLVILESPYRSLLEPVEDYIDQAIAEDPSAMITVSGRAGEISWPQRLCID